MTVKEICNVFYDNQSVAVYEYERFRTLEGPNVCGTASAIKKDFEYKDRKVVHLETGCKSILIVVD